MPFYGYASFIGMTQGKVKGGTTKSRGKGQPILGVYSEMSLAHALQGYAGGNSGQATGRRTHSPITIVKEVDEASPLLWQALFANEALQIEIEIYGQGSNGGESFLNRITLTNARIRDISPYVGPVAKGKSGVHKLSLDYDAITMFPPVPSASLMRAWLSPLVFVG